MGLNLKHGGEYLLGGTQQGIVGALLCCPAVDTGVAFQQQGQAPAKDCCHDFGDALLHQLLPYVGWDVFRGCQCCTIRTAKLACIISSCRRPPEGVDGRCHGADTTKLVVLCYTDEGTQGPRLDSDLGLIRSGLPSCGGKRAWRLKYTRNRVNHHYNTHFYTCTRLKSMTSTTLRPKPSEESRVLISSQRLC